MKGTEQCGVGKHLSWGNGDRLCETENLGEEPGDDVVVKTANIF